MKKRLNRLVGTALLVLMMLSVQDPTLADPRLKALKYFWNTVDDDIADVSDNITRIFRRTAVHNSDQIARQYQRQLKDLGIQVAKQSMIDNYQGAVTENLKEVVYAQTLSNLRRENEKARQYGYAVSDATLQAIAVASTSTVAQIVINWERERKREQTAY